MKEKKTITVDKVLLHPLVSEKAVHGIESQNKIVFNVDRKAGKHDVKRAIEETYNVKVDRVNICNDMKNRKKAIITLKKEFKANDLAVKLKII